jgi:hypothetical protein
MSQFPVSQSDFVFKGKPRPSDGQVLLTHALSKTSLRNFLDTQRCDSSDEHSSLTQLVYEATTLMHLFAEPFTCATASIGFHFKESELNSGYAEGDDIFLIIDGDRVAERTQVFNGDIGRLGEALSNGLDGMLVLTFPYDDPHLHEKLFVLTEHNLRSSFAEPRKRGTFEARIMGGITPGDVLRIFVRQDASQGEIDYALQLFHLATAERALNNQ